MPALLDRPTTLPGLTAAQREQFERDGYLVLRGLFSAEEAADIRDAFMKQAQDGPVAGLSEMQCGDVTYGPEDPLAYYPRMMNPHTQPEREVGQIGREFLLHPRFFPILQDLFGEEPVGVQTMFYFKPPGARGQALHQDNLYLRVKPGTCLAAWLAVDDADEENGGMVVVPGSSQAEIICPEPADHSLFFTSDHVPVPEGLAEEPITLNAGDVLFFNGSLIHGSYPNASTDRFRRALIAHYAPRHSQELAHWYQNPMTFDGEIVAIAPSEGGGPCGTPQAAMARH